MFKRVLPFLALLVAALAVVSLLAVFTGDEETAVQTAGGQPRELNFCRVNLQLPAGVMATLDSMPIAGYPRRVVVSIPPAPGRKPTPSATTSDGFPVAVPWAGFELDPESGEVLKPPTGSDSEKQLLGQVLASIRIGDPDPAIPAWPRTPNGLDEGNTALEYNNVTLRMPDPNSGLMIRQIESSEVPRAMIWLETCRSKVVIDSLTGELDRSQVVPQEKVVFDRFLAECEGCK